MRRVRPLAAMRVGTEVYHALRQCIVARYGSASACVGDEGGFAPDVSNVYEALELVVEAVAASGHTDVVKLGLDVAASELVVRH